MTMARPLGKSRVQLPCGTFTAQEFHQMMNSAASSGVQIVKLQRNMGQMRRRAGPVKRAKAARNLGVYPKLSRFLRLAQRAGTGPA
jgi:hypothetical protein